MSSPFRFGKDGGGRLPSPRHYFSRKFSNRIDSRDVSRKLCINNNCCFISYTNVYHTVLLTHVCCESFFIILVAIGKKCAWSLYTNWSFLSNYAFNGPISLSLHSSDPATRNS
jgi:hypothetical protein